jgi:hypothetical protein
MEPSAATVILALVKLPGVTAVAAMFAWAMGVDGTTLVGVIAPRVSVMAGVVVAFATVPLTPFAVATETLVTVPLALLVQIPFAAVQILDNPVLFSLTSAKPFVASEA